MSTIITRHSLSLFLFPPVLPLHKHRPSPELGRETEPAHGIATVVLPRPPPHPPPSLVFSACAATPIPVTGTTQRRWSRPSQSTPRPTIRRSVCRISSRRSRRRVCPSGALERPAADRSRPASTTGPSADEARHPRRIQHLTSIVATADATRRRWGEGSTFRASRKKTHSPMDPSIHWFDDASPKSLPVRT